MMRAELTLSRLPVGSSASRMEGSLASARAMATRWRSPAESSLGYWLQPMLQAHLAQQRLGALGAVVARRSAQASIGTCTFSMARNVGSR